MSEPIVAPPIVEPARKPTPQPVIEKKQPTPSRVANVVPTATRITLPAPSIQQTQPAPAPSAPAIVEPAPVETAAATSAPQAPTILKYVPPEYPSEAYARKLEGWVQVQLTVTPSGNVVNARIEDGDKRQLFSRAALAAVKQWKYAPRPQATGDTPVTVRLDFKLGTR